MPTMMVPLDENEGRKIQRCTRNGEKTAVETEKEVLGSDYIELDNICPVSLIINRSSPTKLFVIHASTQ